MKKYGIIKTFQVKTGRRKGYYIVTKSLEEDTFTYVIMARQWGILPYEYNNNFYKRHGVSPRLLIWTHSGYVMGKLAKQSNDNLVYALTMN